MRDNKEYFSTIYKIKMGGKNYYTWTQPTIGKEKGVTGSQVNENIESVPQEGTAVAVIHSHGAYDSDFNTESFSIADMDITDRYHFLPIFLASPGGKLSLYTGKKNGKRSDAIPICDCLPYDPESRHKYQEEKIYWENLGPGAKEEDLWPVIFLYQPKDTRKSTSHLSPLEINRQKAQEMKRAMDNGKMRPDQPIKSYNSYYEEK
ncbi:DUF4329 domain-containing protein [Pseudobacter ginsenosidimutans]|nr:DUF4329 domain-containing protein [Pseudobacter ginsenosidimutans]